MEKPNQYNPEVSNSEAIRSENPLVTAYRLAHEKEPDNQMTDIDLAFGIIEVLDNPEFIPRDLAIKCGDKIMSMRNLNDPDYDKRAVQLIRTFEEGVAQNIFPDELGKIDEVHMDQWEVSSKKHKDSLEQKS